MANRYKEYMETPTASMNINSNGTYDVTEKAEVVVNVQPATETFSVTPTDEDQTIIPSEGYTFSMGVVEAMPSGTITVNTPTINTSTGLVNSRTSVSKAGYLNTGTYSRNLQLDTQAATTITPSASAQTAVAAGKYTTGAVTVAAMPSGALSAGSTTINLTGQNVTLSDTYNGIPLYASGRGTVSVGTAGYLAAGTSQQSTSAQQTKYLVGVEVPTDEEFTVGNDGQTEVTNYGNGSVILMTESESEFQTVMENGDWVTTEVEYPTEGGTYYGKVIVPAVTAYTDLS